MKNVLAAAVLIAVSIAPAPAQSRDGPVEVPLRVSAGRLLVPVMMNGATQLEFVLGTGSATTVLSETGSARMGEEDNLTLGGLPVPLEGRVTVPDSTLRADGKVLDGMISSNMLNAYDVLIDAPRGRLVLKPVGRAIVWEGVSLSAPVRVRVFHGIVLALDVVVAGREYPAMLDLGTPMVIVNGGVKTDLGIDDRATVSLKVGARTFDGVPVRVRDLEVFRRWSPDGSGVVLVGATVAHDCPIALSWVHREIRTCVK